MLGIETPKPPGSIPRLWPLSVNAYHALGDLGLIPEKTELLYGQVFHSRSKLRAYADAGVKECWLVLGPEKKIEVHRQPAGEQFVECAVHGPGGTLTSKAVPSFAVDLTSLFAP